MAAMEDTKNADRREELSSACETQRQACERQKEELQRSMDKLRLDRDRCAQEAGEAPERMRAKSSPSYSDPSADRPAGGLIGKSPALKSVIDRIELVAPTSATVLILGESGTGKELIAREIHRRSGRRERPLIKVNCASIPKELYESEFFGHVKGAFTGAINDRVGRFEAADGGTLFLDEVGEIPLSLQGKLLQVVQEGEFERVGEGRTRRVDVRLIAATNKNLAGEVKAGRFREDLYYRLNVFPVEVRPLRERKEDIPRLAVHFVETISCRLNRRCSGLTRANLQDLAAHDWPGNVRELQNAIERALILSPDGRLSFAALSGPSAAGVPAEAGAPPPKPAAVLTDSEIKTLQRKNLLAALSQSGWKIYGAQGAARKLGIKPTTLIERMRRLGIAKPASPVLGERRGAGPT